eukprot:39312-Hanusia_phi.AAC.1
MDRADLAARCESEVRAGGEDEADDPAECGSVQRRNRLLESWGTSACCMNLFQLPLTLHHHITATTSIVPMVTNII